MNGIIMLKLKKIRSVGIVNGIGIVCMLCISAQCMATSILPSLSTQDEPAATRFENTLSAEEITQIENIRNDFKQQLKVSKEHLARVQEAFNRNLKFDTDETVIRQTFPPVAKAMEDIVVQQIMMMQKVNKIISEHLLATSSASQALTQVASEDAHGLSVNKQQ
nr:hypothetical protein [Desulfogranum marinum]